MTPTQIGIGIDLGGTNLRVAVVDGRGTVRKVMKQKLTEKQPSLVAEQLATLSKEALAALKIPLARVAGVGVGVAGQVSGSSGVVIVGPNLGWRDVRFGALVTRALGRPARVVNDLSAAVWGEARAGSARGANDALMAFVGSGVGSGLVLAGKLYEGGGGIAGELGHIKVMPGGRRCGCGENGCLEAYVGGANLRARLTELVAEGRGKGVVKAARGDKGDLHAGTLDLAAEAGDPEAIALREEAARMLGVAIGNLVTVLNPGKLILGGGVLGGAPGLRTHMVEWVRKSASRAHLGQLSIVDAQLGDDAGVVGAALLGLEAG